MVFVTRQNKSWSEQAKTENGAKKGILLFNKYLNMWKQLWN